MNNYRKSIQLLVWRLLWVLLFYQVGRVLFYWSNRSILQLVGFSEFLGGIRFDLSAIFYTNALLILAHTIPGNFKYKKIYQFVLKLFFFLINIIFIATNFIDVEYFKFTSRRSTYSLITASGMESDLPRLILVFVKSYWALLIGFLLSSLVFWKFMPNSKFKDEYKEPNHSFFYKNIPYWILIFSMGMILLVGRGGFQRNPLRIVDAIRYTTNSENTSLVLNTPFSILKTISKKENVKEIQFFDEETLAKVYQPIVELENEEEFQKKNIVLLILESFGEENLFLEFDGQPLTPFMDSLTQNSLYFVNAYANGRRSIDAVPSIITSIPYLMEISYISSPYSFNKVDGFSKILKEKGYRTSFFHGAFTGSQNFYQFCSAVGFDDYYGKEDYDLPSADAEDGVWGIFDEEFLQFTNRKLSTFEQAFFATLFTISSHNPYTIPSKYKNKFPKGNRLIHESISYTDFAVQRFFESAKKENWYQNTVFVITADHTSGDDKINSKYNSAIGNYKIPILIIDPTRPEINEQNPKLIEQIDILPELLDYLNFSGKIFSYGNAPDKTEGRMVANYNQGLYHFIIDNYYVCFDGKTIIKVNDIEKDKLLENNLKNYPHEELEQKIKAYIQQYNNRIIKNKTSLESFEESISHTK